MVLKSFLLYFLPFLVGSLALFAVIKQVSSSFSAKGKKPLLYGGLSSLLASAAAFAATFISNNLFLVFWILSAVYFLFGLIHVVITHRRFFSHPAESRSKLFYAELLFGITIILFSIAAFAGLQYFLKDKSFLFYPMLLSLLFFLVPFLMNQTFLAAYHIPPTVFPAWEYPLLQAIDLPDEKEGERLYVIGFEIAKKASDRQRTFFRAKAPEQMVLGELYYHFINDYNEMQSETPIQYADSTGRAQEWYFRTKPKWYQRSRILDATRTVQQTGIRENTVIICERAAREDDATISTS
ncbi:TssN family type VI secretion system protein [Taibaiella koreensis]|uniref:TssN family type VI secretion system protein n=1 Tax=Taibaiella koreensis TaxID=1268548 RepID=UPI000E59A94B|nr:TssN family type VI secretion system protein [Taibaiella koreensis]